jgi:tetratricopeptide (TPR) repeat protein
MNKSFSGWFAASILTVFVTLGLGAGCSRNPFRDKASYMNRANRYMGEKKYREASIEYRKALRLDQRDVDAMSGLAHAEMALSSWNDAYAVLQQASVVAPNRMDVHLDLGRIYLIAKDYTNAEQEAELVLKNQPDDPVANELMGATLLGEKKLKPAGQYFSHLVALKPDNAPAYVNLAVVQSGLGLYSEVEKNLLKAIQLDPHEIEAYSDLAKLYRMQKKMDLVDSTLQEAISHNPDATTLYIALAEQRYDEKRNAEGDSVLSSLWQHSGSSPQAAIAIGEFYSEWGQLPRAIETYQQGLQKNPDDIDLRKSLTDCYLDMDRLADATTLNEKLLKDAPHDVGVRIEHGRILLAQGHVDEAVTELQQQSSSSPDSAKAHYFLALAFWKKGDIGQAKSAFEAALGDAPDSLLILHSFAQFDSSQGQLDVAQQYAQRAVNQMPLRAEEHLLLGSILMKKKQLPQARAQFEIAKQLVPSDPAVHLALAELNEAGGQATEAEKELESVLAIQPRNTAALGRLADLWSKQGRSAEAIVRVKGYLANSENDANAHVILGSLYLNSKQLELASQEFQRASEINPSLPVAYLQLGRVKEEWQQIPEAIEVYKKALSLQPQFAPLCTLIGNLYLKENDLASAEKYYQQALAADPNFAIAAGNLAWVYLQEGKNLNVAVSLAQKAKQLMPNMDSINDTLAFAYVRQGWYPNAIPLLRTCVQKSPQDAVYHYHLGLALLGAGEKVKGRQELQAALKLNLPTEDARDAQQHLAEE